VRDFLEAYAAFLKARAPFLVTLLLLLLSALLGMIWLARGWGSAPAPYVLF